MNELMDHGYYTADCSGLDEPVSSVHCIRENRMLDACKKSEAEEYYLSQSWENHICG